MKRARKMIKERHNVFANMRGKMTDIRLWSERGTEARGMQRL
jgi:hypothetical protein